MSGKHLASRGEEKDRQTDSKSSSVLPAPSRGGWSHLAEQAEVTASVEGPRQGAGEESGGWWRRELLLSDHGIKNSAICWKLLACLLLSPLPWYRARKPDWFGTGGVWRGQGGVAGVALTIEFAFFF